MKRLTLCFERPLSEQLVLNLRREMTEGDVRGITHVELLGLMGES